MTQQKELESEYIQQKVTEKKATKPAVEKDNSEPVKQVSFFKVCN